MDDDTLGKLLAEVHRDYADYRRPEGVSVSPSSMSVMVDRTGEPVERSDSDHFRFSVRNVKSAQNQFPVITEAERMVDRTGELVERSEIDHFGFSVRNVCSAQNQFPVITQAERMVDRTGKLVEEMIAEERESSSAQIRTLFNEKKLSQSVARKFLITNSKQLEQNKNAKFYRRNYGGNNRIFVKVINKILQK